MCRFSQLARNGCINNDRQYTFHILLHLTADVFASCTSTEGKEYSMTLFVTGPINSTNLLKIIVQATGWPQMKGKVGTFHIYTHSKSNGTENHSYRTVHFPKFPFHNFFHNRVCLLVIHRKQSSSVIPWFSTSRKTVADYS